MKKTDFFIFLALEVTSVIAAVMLFKFVEPNKIAGLFAGAQFIVLGFYILSRLLRASSPLRFFSFYAVSLHLGFSLFLWGARLLYWNTDFNSLAFLGLPMSSFHSFSEKVFILLMICSLIDGMRLQFKSAQ